MSGQCVWRYVSLAKYIDLLVTRAVFLPKAGLFNDNTEASGSRMLCKWRKAQVGQGEGKRRSVGWDPGSSRRRRKLAVGTALDRLRAPRFIDTVDIHSQTVFAYDPPVLSPSTRARWNLPTNFHRVITQERDLKEAAPDGA
jgi:hypothetical protein